MLTHEQINNAKPILFITEMVKAVLDGRKTQFRLPIKLKDNSLICTGYIFSSTDRKRNDCYSFGKNKECDLEYVKPKYKVGDILWAREPVKILNYMDYDAHFEITYQFLGGFVWSLTKEDLINEHKLTEDEFENKYLSKSYMENKQKVPGGCLKEMARIFLKVTNIRVERLQDISDEDCTKEGRLSLRKLCESVPDFDETLTDNDLWQILWDSTVKDGYKYLDNPYVFVYEFERIK